MQQSLLWCAAFVLLGCAHERHVLHSLGGDHFTLFPPPPIADLPPPCSGNTAERLRCFRERTQARSEALDASTAVAIVEPNGSMHAFTHTATGEASPVSEHTDFPLGSISKTIVAATAVSLAGAGELDLQVPIARYLTELSTDRGVGVVTLHQLLTHTAGLADPRPCQSRTTTVSDVIAKHRDAPLWAPPGAVYSYSTLGYILAAAVVERVTGEPFAEVARRQVLAPAGVPTTRFGSETIHFTQAELDLEAHGCPALWSSLAVMNVRELATWAHAFARTNDSPLGTSLVETLTTSYGTTGGTLDGAFGYGIGIAQYEGTPIVSHGGGIGDFNAFLAVSPERRFAAVAFASSRSASAQGMALQALSTFLDLPAGWGRSNPKPNHPLERYTGDYEDAVAGLGTLRVTIDDGQLRIDYPQGPPPLRPPEFRFFFEGAGQARYVVTAVGIGKAVAR